MIPHECRSCHNSHFLGSALSFLETSLLMVHIDGNYCSMLHWHQFPLVAAAFSAFTKKMCNNIKYRMSTQCTRPRRPITLLLVVGKCRNPSRNVRLAWMRSYGFIEGEEERNREKGWAAFPSPSAVILIMTRHPVTCQASVIEAWRHTVRSPTLLPLRVLYQTRSEPPPIESTRIGECIGPLDNWTSLSPSSNAQSLRMSSM